jgi:hypothetical protein
MAAPPRQMTMIAFLQAQNGSVSTRAKPDGVGRRTSSAYAASRMASTLVARRR